MTVNKKRAGELLEFIRVCRSTDYSKRAMFIYNTFGNKFGAISSDDVINNPEYSEEIDYLVKEGLLSIDPTAAPD